MSDSFFLDLVGAHQHSLYIGCVPAISKQSEIVMDPDANGIVTFYASFNVTDIVFDTSRVVPEGSYGYYGQGDIKQTSAINIAYNSALGNKKWDFFRISTVGHTHSSAVSIEADVRDSFYCPLSNITFPTKKNVLDKIVQLVPEKFRGCVLSTDPNVFSEGQLVKYEQGGFFERHRDSVETHRHVATVLFLLPKSTFPHQGGVLKITDANQVSHAFEADDTRIKMVAFDPSLYHECTTVTSGTRYIIKTELKLDAILYQLATASVVNDENLRDPISKREGVIENILKRVANMRKFMDGLEEDIESDRICQEDLEQFKESVTHSLNKLPYSMPAEEDEVVYRYEAIYAEILQQFAANKQFIIIPLVNYYSSENPEFLYTIDSNLRKGLYDEGYTVRMMNLKDSEYNYSSCVSIKDFRYKANMRRDWDDSKNERASMVQLFSTDIDEKFISDERNYDQFPEDEYSEETKVCHPTVILPSRIGMVQRKSEYNDYKYDTSYENHYSCFIISKNE